MKKTAAAKSLAILVGTVLTLVLVLTKTASNFYWDRAPALALRFDGGNNFALSEIANASLLNPQQNGLDLDTASGFALQAIRLTPRDSSSLAVLAFAADAGKFKTAGLPLAERAQAYSKRTLLSQLYFIQQNANAGHIAQALAYYNLALTTHPSSQPLLLPRLYSAIATPEVRRELIKTLGTQPSWKKDFWLGLTNLRPVPPAALQLVEEASPQRVALTSGIVPRLVLALVSSGRLDDAARVADDGQAGSTVRSARSLDDFVKNDPSPPVDWEFDSSGSFNSVPGKSELLLSVRGSREVIFARRLLFLAPGGSFGLNGIVTTHFGRGSLGLTVSCAATNGAIVSKELEISREGDAAFTIGPFTPGTNCRQQWLIVTGLSSGTGRMELGLKKLKLLEEVQ